MFSFIDYTYEIWTVAEKREVDVGVAYDMFRADVAAGEALPYNTGDSLPDFDFAAAKEAWDDMDDEQQHAAFDAYREFRSAKYEEICAAYPDREAVQKIIDSVKD